MPIVSKDCPLKSCEADVNFLIDGSVYCPECSEVYNTGYNWGTGMIEKQYAESAVDLIDMDFEDLMVEYVKLCDHYFRGKSTGFTDVKDMKRFMNIIMLWPIKFSEHQRKKRKEAKKDVADKISRKMSQANNRNI